MYDDSQRPLRKGGRSFYAWIVQFPITCFILTLLADLAYWATAAMIWETSSVWLLAIGLIVAGCAIPAGVIDLVRSRNVRGLGEPWLVLFGHVLAFGLSILNVFVHSRDGYTAVVPQGLILSALVVLVLLATTFVNRTPERTRVGGFA